MNIRRLEIQSEKELKAYLDYQIMIEYAQKIAYSSKETLKFSYEQAKKYADSKGCFVECGVAAGAQIIAMRYGAPNKLIHAFDSFEGIPMPSNRDNQMPGIKYFTEEERLLLPNPGEQDLKTTGMTSVSVDDFKKHMIDSGAGLENLEIHKGWFEETMPVNEVGDIAILRLDGDLYNSTMVCLSFLFDKVIKGGCVIVDDIELKGSRTACEDYFRTIGYTPKYQYVSNIAFLYK